MVFVCEMQLSSNFHFLRILEFEKEVRDGKARKKHSFEIWDVSGNRA
jgi:hypothetical protein